MTYATDWTNANDADFQGRCFAALWDAHFRVGLPEYLMVPAPRYETELRLEKVKVRPVEVTCPWCGGKGFEYFEKSCGLGGYKTECKRCGGTGKVMVP